MKQLLTYQGRVKLDHFYFNNVQANGSKISWPTEAEIDRLVEAARVNGSKAIPGGVWYTWAMGVGGIASKNLFPPQRPKIRDLQKNLTKKGEIVIF